MAPELLLSRHRRESFSRVIAKAVESLPEKELDELSTLLRGHAKERGLLLQGEGKKEFLVPFALTPWVIAPQTARYLQGLFRGIRRTVNRILGHYFEDHKLQQILPLRESELEWLRGSCSGGFPRLQTVFERFDTNLGPGIEEELESFRIIEFNSVGVGCVYLSPAATQLLQEHLLPRLLAALGPMKLTAPPDYRQLLLGDLQAHTQAQELSLCRVGLVERRESQLGGVDEFLKIAEYFRGMGIPALVGDPREVECKNESFFLRGEPIDVVYRDFQIEEVVSIKTHGGSVEGMETAFTQNRVVSSVMGEFDHKSLCELLTNPEFSSYVSPQELKLVRHRIPWTRLLEERRTADWNGKETDLIPTVRENREKLVLKPNRGYGGEGVVVGEAVSQSEWEAALNRAMEKPKTWVTQERVSIAKAPVLVLRESGRPTLEEQYATLGVTATSRGTAFVGRCSDQPVVNISQGGGLVPVFVYER